MVVMLLEFGGVVLFNVLESLQAEALTRMAEAAVAMPSDSKAAEVTGAPLPRSLPLRGGGRATNATDGAWRQAVADKLLLHKEGAYSYGGAAAISRCRQLFSSDLAYGRPKGRCMRDVAVQWSMSPSSAYCESNQPFCTCRHQSAVLGIDMRAVGQGFV